MAIGAENGDFLNKWYGSQDGRSDGVIARIQTDNPPLRCFQAKETCFLVFPGSRRTISQKFSKIRSATAVHLMITEHGKCPDGSFGKEYGFIVACFCAEKVFFYFYIFTNVVHVAEMDGVVRGKFEHVLSDCIGFFRTCPPVTYD